MQSDASLGRLPALGQCPGPGDIHIGRGAPIVSSRKGFRQKLEEVMNRGPQIDVGFLFQVCVPFIGTIVKRPERRDLE